jgi:hypothetical protein
LTYLRDIYRQLKAISLNSKDIVNALYFKANEMNVYLYLLKQTKKPFWKFWKWRSNYFELWLSKKSGNFGISIGRPIIGLIGVHLLIFIILLHFTSFRGVTITYNINDWSSINFWKSFNNFWELIVPIRKFSEELNPFTDILMRLFSGFFVYHLIKATRKFAKL